MWTWTTGREGLGDCKLLQLVWVEPRPKNELWVHLEPSKRLSRSQLIHSQLNRVYCKLKYLVGRECH